MSNFPIMQLWKQWIPGIDNLDRRIVWCQSCQERLVAPFQDLCSLCANKQREGEESRIRRRRKSTGFTDYCIECQSYEKVWIASYHRYCIRVENCTYDEHLNATAQCSIGIDGLMMCALCENCIEKKLNRPEHLSEKCVVWARNIHYIRKTISLVPTPVKLKQERHS